MSMQDLATLGLGLAALLYLVRRAWRRRSSGNCCGRTRCPAAEETLRRIRGA